MTTFERVKEILAEVLRIPEAEVTAEAAIIGDLGADSIALVEILARLENEFGEIEIAEQDLEIDPMQTFAPMTVQQLVNYLEAHTEAEG